MTKGGPPTVVEVDQPGVLAGGLEARGREVRAVSAQADDGLERELDRLASRWAEPPRRPLILWRDGAELVLCRCDSVRARTQARQVLEAPTTEAEAAEAAP